MKRKIDVNAWIHATAFGRHQYDSQEVECWFYKGSVQIKCLICERSQNGDYGFSGVKDAQVIDDNSIIFDDGQKYLLLRRVETSVGHPGRFEYSPLDVRKRVSEVLNLKLGLINVNDWVDVTLFDGDHSYSRFEVRCWCFRGGQKYSKRIVSHHDSRGKIFFRGRLCHDYGFSVCWNVREKEVDCIEFDDSNGHWILRRFGVNFEDDPRPEDSGEDIWIPADPDYSSSFFTAQGRRVSPALDLDDWSASLDELDGDYWEDYYAGAEFEIMMLQEREEQSEAWRDESVVSGDKP